jgi:hypothetical protein
MALMLSIVMFAVLFWDERGRREGAAEVGGEMVTSVVTCLASRSSRKMRNLRLPSQNPKT